MALRLLRVVFGVIYALMGWFGGWALVAVSGFAPGRERDLALIMGCFFAMVGIGGLAMILFIALFGRVRGAPVLCTAPSGAPATFFRRSPFMLVCSVVFCIALAVWAGTVAIVLGAYGHAVWASLPALFALVLLWPVAVVATGKVESGGLWLTSAGLEYRKQAVCWTLTWSELRSVVRQGNACTDVGVLPYAVGLGVAAVEPLVLNLDVGVCLAPRRTAWWVWSSECRIPRGMVCIDCFDLAGGRSVIADMIERSLAYPRSREQLGTQWSVPRQSP